ncbi:hypothetical protein E2P81_ATG10525 [Venturia nashicola]|nr:hypothetical protein E2P81_ATG10525 [Venturia nashicola]
MTTPLATSPSDVQSARPGHFLPKKWEVNVWLYKKRGLVHSSNLSHHHPPTARHYIVIKSTSTYEMQFFGIFTLGMAALAAATTSSQHSGSATSTSIFKTGHAKAAKTTSTVAATTSAKSSTSSKGAAAATGFPVLAAGGALGAAVLGFLA